MYKFYTFGEIVLSKFKCSTCANKIQQNKNMNLNRMCMENKYSAKLRHNNKYIIILFLIFTVPDKTNNNLTIYIILLITIILIHCCYQSNSLLLSIMFNHHYLHHCLHHCLFNHHYPLHNKYLMLQSVILCSLSNFIR